MALKKQITDNKGVITRYHKIQSFETDRTVIVIRLRSFATEAKRNAEQAIEEGNAAAAAHQLELEQLQSQISNLMEENGDGSKTEQIQELTEELNTKTLDPAAPTWKQPEELHAIERSIRVAYFEPITQAALYEQLAADGGDLAGATEI